MPNKTAAQRVQEVLSNYSPAEQSEFYERMSENNIKPSQMLRYLRATEKYNKQMEMARNKYERIFNDSFNTNNRDNNKYFRQTKNGNYRITTAGKSARDLYVNDALSQVAPSHEKSILPGRTMIRKLGFDEILKSREHTASMKGTEYFDWRNSIYFENWKTAVRKNYQAPEAIISAYDKLTDDEKLVFMATSAGKVTYNYRLEEEANKVEQIIDTLCKIHHYSIDEFDDIYDDIWAEYDFELSTPDYIQSELEAKYDGDEVDQINEIEADYEGDINEMYSERFAKLWNKLSRHKIDEDDE